MDSIFAATPYCSENITFTSRLEIEALDFYIAEPEGSSAITELSVQDAQTSAITTNPGVARVYPASSSNAHGDAIKPTCSGGRRAIQPATRCSWRRPQANCAVTPSHHLDQERDVHGDALKPTCSGDTFGPSSQQCDVYGDDLKSPAVVTTSGHQASNAMTSLQLTN
ncbi:hypothetical protein Bca101_008808 [Brassica carinata]